MIRKALLANFAALSLGVLATTQANGAALIIDDRDPNTITITANDFEGGLSIDGNLLQIGIGSPASITLPDGGYSISGSWIDLGGSGARVDLLFALTGDPTTVTSGLELGSSTDGSSGTISGSFGAFYGGPYFGTALPTQLQGTNAFGTLPFLGIEFYSEALVAVPAPMSLALFGAGLLGLGVARRRKA